MASALVFTCDGCGSQRGAANHWYMLAVRDGSPDRIEIWMFVQDHNHPRVQHICGRECLQKVLNRRLDAWERPGALSDPEGMLRRADDAMAAAIGDFGDDDDTPEDRARMEYELRTQGEDRR